MVKTLAETLTAEKALIFRIIHRANLPWILQNGLHCRTSAVPDPNFVDIGNPELIARRCSRAVDIEPGGTLDFTPLSPMLLNIRTGWGVQQRRNEEILILVSSLPALEANRVPYVFTDRHAYLATASFSSDRSLLAGFVDFALLRRRDFKADPDDPGKKERYQAEALAYRHVPIAAILGIGCYTPSVSVEIESLCANVGVSVDVVVRTGWYFG